MERILEQITRVRFKPGSEQRVQPKELNKDAGRERQEVQIHGLKCGRKEEKQVDCDIEKLAERPGVRLWPVSNLEQMCCNLYGFKQMILGMNISH